MHKLRFDTLVAPICKIFFEICKFKDINVFFQESILGVSIFPTSLHNVRMASSTLELPKMVYICQDAYPKKVTRLNICSYLINFQC